MNVPMITIIMPVRNEEKYLPLALAALYEQDYPLDRIQLIIVDGMSDDRTREIAKETLARGGKFRCAEVLMNEKKTAPISLNIGIKRAQGDIIIRIDGHCLVASNYVSKCVEKLKDPEVWCAGGPIETVGEGYIGSSIASAMSSAFGVGGSAFRTIHHKEMFVDTVAFPAYRKADIDKIGLFDEELTHNQDEEYNFRLRKMGGKILLSPEIRSRYYSRSNFRLLWKQFFEYGFWKVRIMQKHAAQMSLRHFIPLTFVLALILGSLLALINPALAEWILLPVLVLYSVALTAAVLYDGITKGPNKCVFLPVVFIIMHVGYGAGFLAGLIKMGKRAAA